MHDIRLFNKNNDYYILEDWGQKREIEIPPAEYLTDFGMIVHDKNKNIAAAWLFPVVTSKTCLIRYPIVNPEVDQEEKDQALQLLFETLHDTARDMNYSNILISTNHTGLQKRLEQYNYKSVADNCQHYIGVL